MPKLFTVSGHSAPPERLLPPEHFHDESSASSLVHLSQSSQTSSRQNSPFTDLPHPDNWDEEASRGRTSRRLEEEEQDEELEAWGEVSPVDEDMPSDLRPSLHRPADGSKSYIQPLLSNGDKHHDYASPHRPPLTTRRSSFKERDPGLAAKAATRKKYTYAGCFLILSLISFTIQTETAVYIQHTLKWNKAYCML